MSTYRDRRAKDIQDAIREVLYREWDPIGVCEAGPRDEYDSYIGQIYHVLASAPSREAVARCLAKIEQESMGFNSVDEVSLAPVVEKLMAIDVRLLL